MCESTSNPSAKVPYKVTSHISQGLTADRDLVNVDAWAHPDLINSRFAYVSVSRARLDVRIYTNYGAWLGKDLSHDVCRTGDLAIRWTKSSGAEPGNSTVNPAP